MIRPYMIHEELRQKIENALEGAIFRANCQLNDTGLFNLGIEISNLLGMEVWLGRSRGIYVGVGSDYTIKIRKEIEIEADLKFRW